MTEVTEESKIDSKLEKDFSHASEEFKNREIKSRAQYKALAEEHEKLKLTVENEKKELLEKVSVTEKHKNTLAEKFLEAELKAQAVSEGIKDVDFIKLIDKSQLKIGENGQVEGVEKLVSDFKKSKPDCFGLEKKFSSSKNADFAEKDNDKEKKVDCLSLSDEEYKAHKASLGLSW